MKCSDVQNRLSAYFDEELLEGEQELVASHLEGCHSCGEQLATFGKLSEMSAGLSDPLVPSGLWHDLKAKLDDRDSQLPLTQNPQPRARHSLAPLMVVAASLIAVSLGVFAYTLWFEADEHEHLAINFEHFLEEFHENPEKAQEILLTSYNGRSTTLEEASALLKYEPVIAKGLPSGCSLKNVYMLDMPCCTCPQAICQCQDGQHIAVFEHDLDQPVWFGDRPSIKCQCDGRPTSIVQIDNRLAVTWKQGDRYITVIGARDLQDVTRFMAHLSESPPNR